MTVLVLDCDGVVVHGRGGRWDTHLERDLGLAPDRLQARFFQPHWKSISLGAADMMAVLEQIWPDLDCPHAPRDFVDYWFAHDARLDEDVLALVGEWRGRGGKAFLATVQEHHRAKYLWETLGLSRHFDGIHYSAALGAWKPDAAFYERVQAKLPAAAPSDVIFLDDAIRNVDAANRFGWKAFHFRSVEDLRKALVSIQPSP